jgi:hypothetical protein
MSRAEAIITTALLLLLPPANILLDSSTDNIMGIQQHFHTPEHLNVDASRPPPRNAAAPYLVADIAGLMVSEGAAHVAAPVSPCGRQGHSWRQEIQPRV